MNDKKQTGVGCSRRMFLIASATTFAGAVLAACGGEEAKSIAVEDVPVGSGIIVGSAIIAQPTAGEYKAYSTVCPHASNPITKIDGDVATCTKHGSQFSLSDGSVLKGPARDPMKPLTVEVDGETISIV